MDQPAAVSTEVRQHYVGLIDALLRAGSTDLAGQCAQLAVEQGVWADARQRPIEYLAEGSGHAVYEPADFWFTQYLEAGYDRIRAELDTITDPRQQGFLPVEEPLLGSGRWDQVVLYDSGRRNDAACRLFPVLTEVIEGIPEATTHGPGVVTLSWLHPGTHIIPHCGRTNAQLRVHLGLRVPPGASIRVGSEQLSWAEGKCIVFDDSFEHEVRHDGAESRVVLLLDVLHPALSQRQRDRLLSRRRSVTEQVARYLAAHDLLRIETDEQGVVLRPAPGTDALIRRYLAETGATAAEAHGLEVSFERE
jgi:aspartate beta-hydroxylase